MSQLIQASKKGEAEGAHLSEAELQATAGLVLAAGFETTVNLLGNGIRLLLDAPHHLKRWRPGRSCGPTRWRKSCAWSPRCS